MANQKGETTSIGHFYNRCVDAVNNLFETMSFWTHAKDVEFDDGGTAQNKVGAIKGITSDLNTTTTGYAADITTVSKINDNLKGFEPILDDTGKITGYKTNVGGADTVFPFSSGKAYRITVVARGGAWHPSGWYAVSVETTTVITIHKDGTHSYTGGSRTLSSAIINTNIANQKGVVQITSVTVDEIEE